MKITDSSNADKPTRVLIPFKISSVFSSNIANASKLIKSGYLLLHFKTF